MSENFQWLVIFNWNYFNNFFKLNAKIELKYLVLNSNQSVNQSVSLLATYTFLYIYLKMFIITKVAMDRSYFFIIFFCNVSILVSLENHSNIFLWKFHNQSRKFWKYIIVWLSCMWPIWYLGQLKKCDCECMSINELILVSTCCI